MFLKNKNIIFKIRRSKVTDYAALKSILENNIQRGTKIMVRLTPSIVEVVGNRESVPLGSV